MPIGAGTTGGGETATSRSGAGGDPAAEGVQVSAVPAGTGGAIVPPAPADASVSAYFNSGSPLKHGGGRRLRAHTRIRLDRKKLQLDDHRRLEHHRGRSRCSLAPTPSSH